MLLLAVFCPAARLVQTGSLMFPPYDIQNIFNQNIFVNIFIDHYLRLVHSRSQIQSSLDLYLYGISSSIGISDLISDLEWTTLVRS